MQQIASQSRGRYGRRQNPPHRRFGNELVSGLFGSATCKEQVNYRQRSLAETAMFRIKRQFGERLKNRTVKNQWVETMLKTNVLNMTSVFASAYFS